MMKLNEDAQDGGLQMHWDALTRMLLHPDKETRETGAVVAVGQGHYKHLLGAFEMHLDKLRQTKKPSNYKPLQAGSREQIEDHEADAYIEYIIEKSYYMGAKIALLVAFRQLYPHNNVKNETELHRSYYLQ
jgi:hypothetical protein